MFFKVAVSIFVVILAVANADGAGSPVDVNANDISVRKALHFAVEQYNKESHSEYINQVLKVIKVQEQIVAGIKYIFTVEMAKTSCKKGEPERACISNPAVAQPRQCTLAVWSQPWLKSMKLVQNTCQ